MPSGKPFPYDWLHAEGENTLNMGIFYDNPEVNDLTEQLPKTTNDKVLKNKSTFCLDRRRSKEAFGTDQKYR